MTKSGWAFNWSHAFNDRWTLRQRFDANLVDTPTTVQIFNAGLEAPAQCTPARCTVLRGAVQLPVNEAQDYFTSLDLTGKIDTWGLHHTLLLGGVFRSDSVSTQKGNFTPDLVPSIDLFHPVHTGIPADIFNHLDFDTDSDATEEWFGFYVQDQIKLPYNVHVLAGFRYDNYRQNLSGFDKITQPPTRFDLAFLLTRPRAEGYAVEVQAACCNGARAASGSVSPR